MPMGCYSTVRMWKCELSSYRKTRNGIKYILISARIQSGKATYYIITVIWYSIKNQSFWWCIFLLDTCHLIIFQTQNIYNNNKDPRRLRVIMSKFIHYSKCGVLQDIVSWCTLFRDWSRVSVEITRHSSQVFYYLTENCLLKQSKSLGSCGSFP